MRARLLALFALTATVALVATAVALAAFGAPEIADPERRTGENDAIPPNRQLVADAHGTALWLSTTSASGPGGPVALYRRCTSSPWPRIGRFGGSGAVPAGIAINPDGVALIVWYEDGATDRTFFSVRRAADGTVGNVETIATADQSNISFALAGNGAAAAAWINGGKLQLAYRPAAGPWEVDTTAETGAIKSRAAIDADGDAVAIAWSGNQERGYYRPAGGDWGGSEKIEDLTGSPESWEVEFTGDGRPVAVYSAQGRVHASIRSGGAWQTTPTELDNTSTNGVVPLARHGSGLVAAWLRQPGSPGFSPLGVARLNGSSWEARKDYMQSYTRVTVSANASGEILLAAGRGDEVFGATVSSISAAWPGSLDRLSPAKDAERLYRDPLSAAGGDAFLLGWAVHGSSDDRSEVIATQAAPACAGDPTPTATATATSSPSPQPVPPTPTPSPTPTPTPKPKPPGLAKFVALPSAKKCVRKLKVRVKKPPAGFAVAKVKLRVNGKAAKVKRKGSTISLRRIPKKRFKLDARVTLQDGQVVKGSRRYRPCK